MTELQEIGTTKSRMEKFEARQRDLNDRAKYRAKVISSASSLIMCAVILVLPLLLAGVQGIKPDFSYRSISEGAIRILLFLAGKYFASQYGATSGISIHTPRVGGDCTGVWILIAITRKRKS